MTFGLRRVATYGFLAVGFVLIAATVGAFMAAPAIAQAVRAALVSNVDDPGRIPYRFHGDCSFFPSGDHCTVNLPRVPDGKRLVITHISGEVNENLPGGTLIRTAVFSHNAVELPVTYIGNFLGLNTFVFDQQVLLVSLAGEDTTANIDLGGAANNNSFATFHISGYMLDCNAGPCAVAAP